MDNNAQTRSEKNTYFFSSLENFIDIKSVLDPEIHCLQECEKMIRQLPKSKQMKMMWMSRRGILILSVASLNQERNRSSVGVVISQHCMPLRNTPKTRRIQEGKFGNLQTITREKNESDGEVNRLPTAKAA